MRKVYREVAQIAGNVITVHAGGVGNQELAVVQAPGFSSLAQVIRLEGDDVTMQVFSGTRGIPTDAEVRFLGRAAPDAVHGGAARARLHRRRRAARRRAGPGRGTHPHRRPAGEPGARASSRAP